MAATLRQTRRIYLAISVLLTATAICGFWPGYFSPLLRGGTEHFWFIHVHAAVFLGWIMLLSLQAVCVASDKLELHRKIGIGGAFWGALVIAVGLFVSVAAPVARVNAGQLQPRVAELVVMYNLTDMAVFSVLFAFAIHHVSRPPLHRRLMVCAGIALTGAAVGRMLASGSLAYLGAWLAPFMLAVAGDLALERRIHLVFWLAGAAFVFMFLKVEIYSQSEIWHTLGRAIAGPFLS